MESLKPIFLFFFFYYLTQNSYATSFVLERTSGIEFEKINEAGRLGRMDKENCQKIYVDCNDK